MAEGKFRIFVYALGLRCTLVACKFSPLYSSTGIGRPRKVKSSILSSMFYHYYPPSGTSTPKVGPKDSVLFEVWMGKECNTSKEF